MSVRPRLPPLVHAGTLVLNECARLRQAAVLLDWEHFDAASAVIGHEHVLSRWVHHQMTRPIAARSLLVYESQLPGFGIDGEAGDRAGLFTLESPHLIGGVE